MLPRAYPLPFPVTRRLTVLTAALLAIHVILAWLALQAAFIFVELAWRAVAAPAQYRALLVAHVGQFRTLRAIQAALWLATAAAFLRWVARAHGNLPALGATGLGYSPRQATMAFLVPGPNLVRPPGVLRELWNASDPRYPSGMTWRAAPMPCRVRGWWIVLVGALGLDVGARGMALVSGLALDLGPAMLTLMLAQVCTAAAAVLGIAVVLGVDARQDAAAWRRVPAGESRE